MKKHSFLLSISLAGVIVFLSCHKIDDVHLKRVCRIDQMNCVMYGFGDSVFRPRYFTYNEYGNPVRVAFERVETGADSYEFFYDNKQRLIRLFVSTDLRTHNYTYNDEGDIIVDSAVNYYRQHFETKYYYDTQKRIIRTVWKIYEEEGISEPSPYLNEEHIIEYKYDNRGNLIREGIIYDNKVNIHRTNKIWQFVDKDYSANNPFINEGIYSPYFQSAQIIGLPSEYNEFGLPLNNVGFLGYPATHVFYDCAKLSKN